MAVPLLKSDSGFDSPNQHFELLHDPAHGTSILWERSSSATTSGVWHKLRAGDPHIPALLAAQSGLPDRFITVNEFYGWRLVRNIKSLRACYVDLDSCDNLPIALEALRDAALPPPTAAVWSGRGLHLYWMHEAVPGKVIPVWQRCQDTLVKALSVIGADPAARDCTRVLRLAGSINSKNGQMVRGLVLDPTPYTFRHLCDEILGYREPKAAPVRDLATAKAERGLPSNRKGSIYARWHLVYRDLLTIAEHYFLGGIPHGHRNDWLFLSAVALSWFANPATLRGELERVAATWTPDLRLSEVRSAIKTPLDRAAMAAEGKMIEWQGQPCDPRYRFKRETLLEWMQSIITPDLAPLLRAIVPAEVKTKRHAEAKKQYEATRDRVMEGRHETHQRGRKQGSIQENSLAQQKPWEVLGISRRTYFNRKKAGTL